MKEKLRSTSRVEFERIEQWLNLVAPALMRDVGDDVRHRFNE
jgi:hypothetical protein